MDTVFRERNREYREAYVKLWWSLPEGFPQFDREYSRACQKRKAKETEDLVACLIALFRNCFAMGIDELEVPGPGTEAVSLLRQAGAKVLEFNDPQLDLILGGGFSRSASRFIRSARVFDSTMGLEEILQALRNVWIMNCIQVLLGQDPGYSPSIYAYSMLYPYTDNYIDTNSASDHEKNETLKKFGKMLEGEDVVPSGSYERGLSKLVQTIEGQYPRREYADLYSSLCAIHHAQCSSIRLQKKGKTPYETDILGISFEKGGTSVLADAYLVNGRLDRQQAEFMYGFGIFLQLLDDMQDAADDRKHGHMTLFSQTSRGWKLDGLANKLFNFIFTVMDTDSDVPSAKRSDMKKVIRDSCCFLLLAAIAQNRKFFSRKYVRRLQNHSPLAFRDLYRFSKKVGREYADILKKDRGIHAEEVIAAVLAQ